ncbi:MAG: hypothetical protein JO280_04180 [Mycobacteriaceae bacterium]|nr:hypothetical protein [Mycobacteriaceae bacterium]
MNVKKLTAAAGITGALGLGALGLGTGLAHADNDNPWPQPPGPGWHDNDWRGDRDWHGDRDAGWRGDRDWRDRGNVPDWAPPMPAAPDWAPGAPVVWNPDIGGWGVWWLNQFFPL